MSTHTYGSITLLWRFDYVSGLQVFDREKDGWFDVPIAENSIVVNIGDLFQDVAMTNLSLRHTG
jgi:isopenicillin N synthase-like dioxygenase